MSHIAVVGAGYVGLVTGACLADLGHTVTVVEIEPDRLGRLLVGEVPFHEPGLDPIVDQNRIAGRLRFTDDHATAVANAEFVFIAVHTPPAPDGQADTRFVFDAVRTVLRAASSGQVLITKSTVPVGTGDAIAALAGEFVPGVHVASNPEFLRQGSAVEDFFQPDRVVVGAEDRIVAGRVAALYDALDAPVLLTDRRSAELAKYAANALLATKISFMNEVAAICSAVGADVDSVARIVGADERIGPAFLRAGLGWGGSCFPKDVKALRAIAHGVGARAPILDAIHEVNDAQRDRAVAGLLSVLDGVEQPTVAVLGLAFKPHTDDLRGSPAIEIIRRLVDADVHVRAHDPVAMPNARRVLPAIHYATSPYDALRGAHAVLLATEWPEYAALDWARAASLLQRRIVFDGRHVLDVRQLGALGFRYLSFGRRELPGDVVDRFDTPVKTGKSRAQSRERARQHVA